MQRLFKKLTIVDESSPYHNTIKDILVTDQIIEAIEDTIEANNAEVVVLNNAFISQGWVDVFANFNDPGFEHKETILTGANTALYGGYTSVFTLPNTNPCTDTKAQIDYVLTKSKELPVDLLPLGSVTKKGEGNQLAEIYDMQVAGAIAFTDGIKPIQNDELLLKALQYVLSFGGIVIQQPINKNIGIHGQINEGVISTKIGLAGMPAFAEEIFISRNIEVLRYTKSKLHLTGISTAKGIELITQAKNEGLNVTCSVSTKHLLFCDEDLETYNTNLKLNPPLRTKEDKLALQQAVLYGKIDCIASHHFPQDWDNKVCEFAEAAWGSLGLQTCFNELVTALPEINEGVVAKLLSSNAASIFGLQKPSINVGQQANFTLFTKHETTNYSSTNNKSKSSNSALLNTNLQGKVLGVYCKENFYLF